MRIAPIDIAHKTFGRKMMGLDADEVGQFLGAIAAEMETLIKERNQLRENLREKDMAIMEFKDRDQILKDTITTAHKMAETMRADAEREAKLIINDAQHRADLVVRDARDSLKSMYKEVSDLKRIRLQFEARMNALLQAHLALLKEEDFSLPDISVGATAKPMAASPAAPAASV